MGLLFGKRDLDQTIVISTRCGMDSDCNPSSSAGVLFTTVGFSKLPARFSEQLNEKAVFSHTAYNFPALLDVCEKLAREALAQNGGRVEKDAAGEEVFALRRQEGQAATCQPPQRLVLGSRLLGQDRAGEQVGGRLTKHDDQTFGQPFQTHSSRFISLGRRGFEFPGRGWQMHLRASVDFTDAG